jgi:mannonate dehydratase
MTSHGKTSGRRGFLRAAGTAALAGPLWGARERSLGVASVAPRGLPPLKITDVRVTVTCPDRTLNYVLVKILTSEPGLYGVGDASLIGYEHSVAALIEKHFRPLLVGRDPDQIEDTWQMLYRGPYWRRGPAQMSAIAGIDLALWDIKGKRAGMPLYQLLGGRTRRGALAYVSASGRDFVEVEDGVKRFLEQGFRCVRAQVAIPGLENTYGAGGALQDLPVTEVFEPSPYLRTIPKLFEHLRAKLGEEVELLHDTHEKLTPIQGARLAKELEPFHLFFLEDLVRPEHKESFRIIRQHTTTPLAMGEMFDSIWDAVPLITEQLIDYIRCDLGHIGGITAGRKVAALAEPFHVKTAWHGPPDIGPLTHAANVHLDVSIPNFGVQERAAFSEAVREVIRGVPETKDGYLDVSEAPGLGGDFDENLAKKYPYQRTYLPHARRRDGSVQDW